MSLSLSLSRPPGRHRAAKRPESPTSPMLPGQWAVNSSVLVTTSKALVTTSKALVTTGVALVTTSGSNISHQVVDVARSMGGH